MIKIVADTPPIAQRNLESIRKLVAYPRRPRGKRLKQAQDKASRRIRRDTPQRPQAEHVSGSLPIGCRRSHEFSDGLLIIVLSFVYSLVLFPTMSFADIAGQTRYNKAEVIYEFGVGNPLWADTSVNKGIPISLTPLVVGSSVSNEVDALGISGKNLLYSVNPAQRLISACRNSNEMSFEVWLENNESARERSGFSPTSDTRQPLRILTLSDSLNNQNFSLGQFYEDGNIYAVTVSTSGKDIDNNGNPRANTIGSMNSPLMTTVGAPSVPLEVPLVGQRADQVIVFTLSRTGAANLYLTDRNGQMYLAKSDNTTFTARAGRGLLSSWKDGLYLTLGNVYTNTTELARDRGPYDACADDNSIAKNATVCNAGSRYWKGRIKRVAVYCQALTKDEVLGAGALTPLAIQQEAIDLGITITPNLERARQIHQRLTGSKLPISSRVFNDMKVRLDANDPVGAAGIALEDPYFYNVVLRDFAAKMSNRDETIAVPLNDFTASIIGAVRDNMDARQWLTENFIYMADPSKAAVPSNVVDDILKSNIHYEALTTGRFDLSKVLVRRPQSVFDGSKAVDNPTPAGLLTTRQFLAAHAVAGTNRRLVEYSLKEFTCTPIEKAADASGPDDVIARDIDRFPGGSHTKYTQSCRACHTVLDGFRPAFAPLTFNNTFVMHSYVTPKVTRIEDEDAGRGILVSSESGSSTVHYKYNKNSSVFAEGRVVSDDNWINNANFGGNKTHFGWVATKGKGIRDFGNLIAQSAAFPRCLAQRVFYSVCKREPAATEEALINAATSEFKNRSYDVKYLFKRIVSSNECIGAAQ